MLKDIAINFKPLKIKNLHLTTPIIMAPMAGITDSPFRRICYEKGCPLAYTEMVSVKGLCFKSKKTFKLLKSTNIEKPIGIQLFGADPEYFAEATKMLDEYDFDIIDINMGCPVKKVVKTGSGAALLNSPSKVEKIVTAVKSNTNLPVSVKIRSGWSSSNFSAFEVASAAENAGADVLVYHPRFRDSGYSTPPNWQYIKELKNKVKIPVIGNGNIFFKEDAYKILSETNCDGIMIARGVFGNPWIFSQIISPDKVIDTKEKYLTIKKHFDLHIKECNDMSEKRIIKLFWKHICWYVKGIRGAAQFRQKMHFINTFEELFLELQRIFKA